MALSEYSKRLLGAYAEQPFLMAPMAGVTDPAYRIMCRRRGANLAYSEMVSVAGLAYASNKTWRLVLPADEEQQICVQLFGSKPEQFASAVAAVEERVGDRLSLIDINMACPARKVVTKGEGSALMRTPDLAEKIVEATAGAAHVPVTGKIRKGFYAEDRNAATFAQMLESAGAAAVAVHGRCATQLYTGQADWSVVDEVADAVEIPVIGSGDVFSAEDAAEHLHGSGASAVFIARGIYGNPWVFGDARALALDGTPVPSRSSVERLDALREHLTLTHELLPLMSRARTYASWYLKGMPHAAAIGRSRRCTGKGITRAHGVITRALLLIRKYGIGFGNLFKLFLGIRLLVDVRMELAGLLLEGLLNITRGGVLRDTQNLVVIFFVHRRHARQPPAHSSVYIAVILPERPKLDPKTARTEHFHRASPSGSAPDGLGCDPR